MAALGGSLPDLSTIPLAPNPNGDPPNFTGGPSLFPTVVVTGLTFIVLSFPFVVVRIHTGIKKSGRLFADDWLCIIAECTGIAQVVCLIIIMSKGIGKHSWNVPVSAITPYALKLLVANTMLAMVTHLAVKTSLSLFFIRLFGTLKWVRVLCYSIMTVSFLAYVSFEIAYLVLCIPHAGEEWDNAVLTRCTTLAPSTIAVGVGSVLIDLAMFILPFPIIAGLVLSRAKKRGLFVIFLIGFFIVVTSVASLAYRIIVSYQTTDVFWHAANVAITAYVEVFGTIIVSCAPSLPTFWSKTVKQTPLYSKLKQSNLLPFLSTSPGSRRGDSTRPQESGQRGDFSLPKQSSEVSLVGAQKPPPSGSSSSRVLVGHAEMAVQSVPYGHSHAISKSTTIEQEISGQGRDSPNMRNGEWEMKTMSKQW